MPIKFDDRILSVIIDTHKSFKDLSPLVDPEDKKANAARKVKESVPKPVEKKRSATLLENLRKIVK